MSTRILSSTGGKNFRVKKKDAVVTTTPDPDPLPDPGADVVAYVAAAKAVPEAHNNHQWMTSNSTYYAAIYSAAGKGFSEMQAIWGNIEDGGTFPGITPKADATKVAIADGSWFNAANWYPAGIPGAGAKVLIPGDRVITYDGISSLALTWVRVEGELNFSPSVNTKMVVDTMTNGYSGTIEIGTAAAPIQADKTCIIEIPGGTNIDVSADPLLFSRGIISEGLFVSHGAPKTPYAWPTAAPLAGQTSVSFAAAVTGWRVGDLLLIPGTRHTRSANSGSGTIEDDEITITAISPDNKTVTFTPALVYNHTALTRNFATGQDEVMNVTPWGRSLIPPVENLSRNIKISTPGDYWRDATWQAGHVMFMHALNISIQYTEFSNMGRTDKRIRSFPATGFNGQHLTYLDDDATSPAKDRLHPLDPAPAVKGTDGRVTTVPHTYYSNVQGRYGGPHIHRAGFPHDLVAGGHPNDCPRTGDPICTCGKAKVYGCVVKNTTGWAYARHESIANFDWNIAYRFRGVGFMDEVGNEAGRMSYNIASTGILRNAGWGEWVEKSSVAAGDFGRFNGAFWFAGRNGKNEFNGATNVNGGHIWQTRGASRSPIIDLTPVPNIHLPLTPGETVGADKDAAERPFISQFDDCWAIAAVHHTLVIKSNPSQDHDIRTMMRRLWGFGLVDGLNLTYTGHYTMADCEFVAHKRGGSGIIYGSNSSDMVTVNLRAHGFDSGLGNWGRFSHAGPQLDFRNWLIGIDGLTGCQYNIAFGGEVGERLPNVISGEYAPWLQYLDPANLVPGRLNFSREHASFYANVGTYYTSYSIDGLKTDSLGSRARKQDRSPQAYSVAQVINFVKKRGYWTYNGEKYGKMKIYLSDRVTGDYIECDIPLPMTVINGGVISTTGWVNNGPLEAEYIAKLPAGSTWTSGEALAPRFVHNF